MAIRFEYGPKPSALGNLAYQAGAAQAADQRRREVEALQVQAAQMAQQQEQAALDRQFNAWRTQYDHYSSVDRAQRDHVWRNNFQEKDHENALEMNKFQAAQQQRANNLNQINMLERQRQQSDLTGNRQVATEIRTKQNGQIEELRGRLNQQGVAAEKEAKRKYERLMMKPNLSPQHRQQARREYIGSLRTIAENPDNTRDPWEWEEGYEGPSNQWGVRPVRRNGQKMYEIDPLHDPRKSEVIVGTGVENGKKVEYYKTPVISSKGDNWEWKESKRVVGDAPDSPIERRDKLLASRQKLFAKGRPGKDQWGDDLPGTPPLELTARGEELLAIQRDKDPDAWRDFKPSSRADQNRLAAVDAGIATEGEEAAAQGPAQAAAPQMTSDWTRSPGGVGSIRDFEAGEQPPAEPPVVEPPPKPDKAVSEPRAATDHMEQVNKTLEAYRASGESHPNIVGAAMARAEIDKYPPEQHDAIYRRISHAFDVHEAMKNEGFTRPPSPVQDAAGARAAAEKQMRYFLTGEGEQPGGAPQGAQPATQPVTQTATQPVTSQKERGDKKKPVKKRDPWDDKKITQKESQAIMADSSQTSAMLNHPEAEKMLTSAMKNDPALKKKVGKMFGIGASEGDVMKVLTAKKGAKVSTKKFGVTVTLGVGEGLSKKEAKQFYNLAKKVHKR